MAPLKRVAGCVFISIALLSTQVAASNYNTFVPPPRCYHCPDPNAKPFPQYGDSDKCRNRYAKYLFDMPSPVREWELDDEEDDDDQVLQHDVTRQEASEPVITFDSSTTYQTIDGFGGSIAFFGNWITNHEYKTDIYDLLFSELKPSVLRLRNHYDTDNEFQTSSELMDTDREHVDAAKERLGSNFDILMSSWSPPKNRKASGEIVGVEDFTLNTMKKTKAGAWNYSWMARHWLNSLLAYESLGVVPRWVSIQNEPDYTEVGLPSCLLAEEESDVYPSYFKTLRKTSTWLADRGINVTLIGPESTGFDSFIDSGSAEDRLSIVANHLYKAGDQFTDENFFSNLEAQLEAGRAIAEARGYEKMYMTEFANLAQYETSNVLDFAKVMYMTLTTGHASMYLNWDLMWGEGFGEGTLMLVENPFDTASWTTTQGYYTTPAFWWFSHFTRYVRPGSVRVGCNLSEGLVDILAMCFKGEGDAFTMIIINLSLTRIDINLEGLPSSPTGFEFTKYRMTERRSSRVSSGTTSLPIRGRTISTLYRE